MSYEPGGRMKLWLAAMRAEPERVWTPAEAAAVMGIPNKKVGGYAEYAILHGFIFQSKKGRGCLYALHRFEGFLPPPKGIPQGRRKARAVPKWEPGDDIRIPKVVPGWTPPKMVCVRVGA